MRQKQLFRIFLFLLIFTFGKQTTVRAQQSTGQTVDVVFCLDLSSSANGLIDHLRNHLWDYWYFFSRCQPVPNYRIGVVAYSCFSYGKSNGYAKMIKDLGTDFEPLSNILYKIPSRIEKGDQYVGSALSTCLKKISWSKDPDAIKMIFLVGNGDVTLGAENIDRTMEKLSAQGVIIYPIYCTVPGERKTVRQWQRIAENSGGKLSTISIRNKYFDQLNGFDIKKFRTLNRKFNNTYLYYGQGGYKRWKMLNDEDNHVYITNTEGYRYRALYKISDDYQKKNASWDLVDLYYKNPVAFMDVDRKTLNDTCKKMKSDQLKAYIIYKKYERKKLSAMIADMIAEKEMKDKADGKIHEKTMGTLDIISIRTLRELLQAKQINCPTN